MKTYLMHRVIGRDGHIGLCKIVMTFKAFLFCWFIVGVMILLNSTKTLAQPVCADYCIQGYIQLDLPDDSICFSLSDTAKVCLEIDLYWITPPPQGCDPNATVRVAIYKFRTPDLAAPANCNSDLMKEFTASTPDNTNACPNGAGVECCCLSSGNYYIKVLDSNGNNYGNCYTGHVKVCFDCTNPQCP